MGEVYKATDSRLNRSVAIKVLLDSVASDSDRKQRFAREAKAISSLSHPNICTLHDVGSQDGIDFLVMEYLEGETLAQRLMKGPLPLEHALGYAITIADALETAHRQGIVHRDLKPGNVMLTGAGAKLLDFGLAKLTPRTEPSGAVLYSAATTNYALTSPGSILGTVQYMAPEQIEGQEADARSDIFAFGALLYEMVIGKKAFEGKTQAGVIGAILERQPPSASAASPSVPPALDAIITTCLARKPDDRWQNAGDIGRQLKWILEADSRVPVELVPVQGWRRAAALALVSTALISGGVGASAGWWLTRSTASVSATVSRLVLTPGDTTALVNVTGFDVVISPDGTQIVYLGERSQGGRALYLRGIAGLNPRMIPGTELPSDFTNANPFFSWDGAWVGYRSPSLGLVKVPVTGGMPTRIAELEGSVTFMGGAWGPDGRVLTALLRGGSENGLYTVSGEGAFTRLTPPSRDGLLYLAPAILPSGRAVVFQVIDVAAGTERVDVLDLGSGTERTVIEGGANPTYLASGHLVFARGNTLMAVGFDANALEVMGTPVAVVEDVRHPGLVTAADYSVSRVGDLIYVPNLSQASGNVIPVWVDRAGRTVGTAVASALENPRDFELSPDGSRLAVITGAANDGDLWVYDLNGRPPVPLIDKGDVRSPLWSKDGTRLFFTSNRGGGAYEVYSVPANGGTLEPQLLPTGSEALAGDLTWRAPRSPLTWLPDGRLAFTKVRATGGGADVVSIGPSGGATEDLVKTDFDEDSAQMSSDGRWLAYRSTRTGQSEIWVKALADSAAVRVSSNGGQEPVWSAAGHELYYVENSKLMVVPVNAGTPFTFQPARALFDAPFFHVPVALTVSGWNGGRSYDVGADGRFLMIPLVNQSDLFGSHDNIVVVQNWQEELKRLVPAR
jgi:Tol biopolymer transport system component